MRFTLISDETKDSLIHLLKWAFIALLGGGSGAVVVETFSYLLNTISNFIDSFNYPPFLFPVMGAVIVGGTFYLIEPRASGEGIPSYIRSVSLRSGIMDPRVTLFKYLSALITLSFRGSGGVIGPLSRASAGLSSYIISELRHLRFSNADCRLAAICGVSGAIGDILHAPIGGGIFAVEILQRSTMNYRDLFPAILASSFAFIINKQIDSPPFYLISAPHDFMRIEYFGWLLVASVLAGLIGIFFVTVFEKTSLLFGKLRLFQATLIGGLFCSLLALINPDVLGTSQRLLASISAGDYHIFQKTEFFSGHLALLFLSLILLKILATSVTIGSGLSAGLTGPTILIGMLSSMVICRLAGVEVGSATFFSFIANGVSGMLAAVMNVPIAAAVISTEMLGFNYSFPAVWGSIIGYQIASHKTIYKYSMMSTEEH